MYEAHGVTNVDGRAPGLTSAGQVLHAGLYRLRFHLEDYFQRHWSSHPRLGGQRCFYPFAEVSVRIAPQQVRLCSGLGW